MQNQCAAPNCPGGLTEHQPLFRFPLDPERSKTWLEKSQRPDLAEKLPEQLYRHFRLCAKHFDSAIFDDESQRTVLKGNAIPTVFDKSSEVATGQVKRSNEKTKESEVKSRGRKKAKKSQDDTIKEEPKTLTAEEESKEYVTTLFELVLMLGEQSIPPQGSADSLESSNFQALLDHRMSCGDKVLKKMYENSKECCSFKQLQQIIEVCEKSIRSKVIEEVKQSGFFSVITDDLVKISGQWYLPVFLRFVDQSYYRRETFAGFVSFNGDDQAESVLAEMTEWGLDLGQCRGQAHSFSGLHFSQMKAFATKLMEKNPKAVLTLRCTRTLNESLASCMSLSAVQLVMSTLRKIEAFFGRSNQLQQELEHALFIFYPDKEEKAQQLKETLQTNWTRGHDAFEVALEILEALLLCIDSVHDNEDMRWTDQVTNDALDISKALTDFEFVMALVVLKNLTTLTRAFGKNLEGGAADVRSAADSVEAVLQSLKEVSDNIDVYHEFWSEEAVTLATAMETPVKVPRPYLRKSRSQGEEVLGVEKYYKVHLSVPVVKHFIDQLSQLFSEDHLKNLRGLSLVPTVIEQHKSTQPEEECVQVFNEDIPNAANLSAELHCWWVKWSKRGKAETFPCSLHETLQLPDVKFFPNVLAVLRRIGVLPTLTLEENCDTAFKRFKMYMKNTPGALMSKSLALLNMNCDYVLDLDAVVEMYLTTCSDQQEGS